MIEAFAEFLGILAKTRDCGWNNDSELMYACYVPSTVFKIYIH